MNIQPPHGSVKKKCQFMMEIDKLEGCLTVHIPHEIM